MGSTPMGPSLVALVTGARPGLPPSKSIPNLFKSINTYNDSFNKSLILVEFLNNSYFPFKKGEIVKYSHNGHLLIFQKCEDSYFSINY